MPAKLRWFVDSAVALQRLETRLQQLTLEEREHDQEQKDLGQDLLNAQQQTSNAVAALGNTLEDVQSHNILLCFHTWIHTRNIRLR